MRNITGGDEFKCAGWLFQEDVRGERESEQEKTLSEGGGDRRMVSSSKGWGRRLEPRGCILQEQGTGQKGWEQAPGRSVCG